MLSLALILGCMSLSTKFQSLVLALALNLESLVLALALRVKSLVLAKVQGLVKDYNFKLHHRHRYLHGLGHNVVL